MTLFDYYLQYMTQVWEGKRPAPEGITLPEDGDEAARIQALGRQLQAMGMADFVRACAAQDGTVLPEELFVTESSDLGGFQVFLQGTETPEAAPETPPRRKLLPSRRSRTLTQASTPSRSFWTASPWTMGWCSTSSMYSSVWTAPSSSS